MTHPNTAPSLADATERLADLFRSTDTAYEVGPTLQCTEADAVADLPCAPGIPTAPTRGSTRIPPRMTKATSTTKRPDAAKRSAAAAAAPSGGREGACPLALPL